MTVELDQGIRAEVLTTVAELGRIAVAWRRLWQQARWATPFQRPEWLLPWCRWWADAGVHVLSLWRGDALVGLVPWRIDDDGAQRRRALLLGAGPSDYLDALVAPEHEPTAAAAILAHLADLRRQVELCELDQLAPQGILARTLHASEWGDARMPGAACPVLPLVPGTASLADCLPKEHYKKLQYYRRRLQRSGTAEYERVGPDNFDASFSDLVRLHTARWNGRDEPGVLKDPAVERFHREAARRLLRAGLLRQYVLRLDRRVIAAYYGFHARGRSYYYLSGFEPAYRQLSPGMLIVGHAVEQAAAEHAVEFDFLRGQESYKYVWGANDQPTYCWRFARP